MNVELERYTEHHAEGLARLCGDPVVARQLLQVPYRSAEQWRRRQTTEREGTAFLVAMYEGRVVGCATVKHHARVRRQHSGGIGMGVAADCQGRGVSSRLLEALLDLADNWFNLHRVELTVFADNLPALALYAKFGFEQEWRLRDYAVRDGRYVDVLSMARLRTP